MTISQINQILNQYDDSYTVVVYDDGSHAAYQFQATTSSGINFSITNLTATRQLKAGTPKADVNSIVAVKFESLSSTLSYEFGRNGAFTNLSNLIKVVFPRKSLLTLRSASTLSGPFQNCTGLQEVEIPNKTGYGFITEWGVNKLFWDCTSLTGLTLPYEYLVVGQNADEQISSLGIYSLLKKITNTTEQTGTVEGDGGIAFTSYVNALSGCSSLQKIDVWADVNQPLFSQVKVNEHGLAGQSPRQVPINLIEIEDDYKSRFIKLYYDQAYKVLDHMESYEENGEYYSRPVLKDENIVSSEIRINVPYLQELTVPEILYYPNGTPVVDYDNYDNYEHNGLSVIKRIELPSGSVGIKEIGRSDFDTQPFYKLTGLEELTIPSSVSCINNRAFDTYDDSYGDYHPKFSEVHIPLTVTKLEPNAFSNSNWLSAKIFDGRRMSEIKAMDGYPWGARIKTIIAGIPEEDEPHNTYRYGPIDMSEYTKSTLHDSELSTTFYSTDVIDDVVGRLGNAINTSLSGVTTLQRDGSQSVIDVIDKVNEIITKLTNTGGGSTEPATNDLYLKIHTTVSGDLTLIYKLINGGESCELIYASESWYTGYDSGTQCEPGKFVINLYEDVTVTFDPEEGVIETISVGEDASDYDLSLTTIEFIDKEDADLLIGG